MLDASSLSCASSLVGGVPAVFTYRIFDRESLLITGVSGLQATNCFGLVDKSLRAVYLPLQRPVCLVLIDAFC